MALTHSQLIDVKDALLASTDPQVQNWVSIRNDTALAEWLNSASAVNAWRNDVSGSELSDEMKYNLYDTITAAKRDAWAILVGKQNCDFTKVNIRKAITDIWAAEQQADLLNVGVEKASQLEVILGYSNVTTGPVTAAKREYVGEITVSEVSLAFSL